MVHDLLIVGGGIAGLSLARALVARGRAPVILERARGVGGRCATRRIDDQPVDHGVAVLHGRSPAFCAAMAAASDQDGVAGWPRAIAGAVDLPRHEAFDRHTSRVVPPSGVNVLARHLARGLDVRLECRSEAIGLAPAPTAPGRRVWTVTTGTGDVLHARTLVLAVPPPSIRALLATLDPPEAAVAELLRQLEPVEVEPCLTVIARYAAGTLPPPWDVSLPGPGHALERILHDSAKRAGTARLTLVMQARPEFSRAHLELTPDHWSRMLLDVAAALHGAWIAAPELVQPHRWGYARVVAGTELEGPLVAACEGGAVLGLAGDGFDRTGGVEGAFLSGLALAARLSARSTTMGARSGAAHSSAASHDPRIRDHGRRGRSSRRGA